LIFLLLLVVAVVEQSFQMLALVVVALVDTEHRLEHQVQIHLQNLP